MSYAASLRTAVRRRSDQGSARLVLPALFLMLALPVLVVAALIVPTGEAPDEVAHIVRANSLLHGEIMGHRIAVTDALGQPAQDAVVDANFALLAAGFAFPPGAPKRLTRERLEALRGVSWSPSLMPISVPNTAVYMPLFYLPSAFGLGAAHLAGLTPYDAIIAARVCNAAGFVSLGVLALLLTRRAQGVIFATLLLPMTTALAASCNQDGLLIASACLAAALWSRYTLGAWWSGVMILALLLATKPLYLPLAGIAALAAPVRGFSVLVRAAGLLAAAVPALLWYAASQRYVVVPFLQPIPYPAGKLWPTAAQFTAWDPALQLQVLRHDPKLLFSLPMQTLQTEYGVLGLGLVGVLGTLDVLLPPDLYTAWYWALAAAGVAAMFGSPRAYPGPPFLVSVLGLGCVLAASAALVIGSYLAFTPIGADQVAGLQGRYALPLLPMIGFLLPRARLPGGGSVRAVLLAPTVAAAATGLLVIPNLLVTTYYLR